MNRFCETIKVGIGRSKVKVTRGLAEVSFSTHSVE